MKYRSYMDTNNEFGLLKNESCDGGGEFEGPNSAVLWMETGSNMNNVSTSDYKYDIGSFVVVDGHDSRENTNI